MSNYYKPESDFRRVKAHVYNLRENPRKHPTVTWINDVSVVVEAGHLPQDAQDRIGDIIATALNREFGLLCGSDCGHTDREHAAFDAGFIIGEAGIERDEFKTPFESDTDEYEAWLNGYSSGYTPKQKEATQ